MKSRFSRVIGIDVAKQTLQFADSQNTVSGSCLNEAKAIEEEIIGKLDTPERTLVVCEATGGCEHTLVRTMHQAGIAIAVANPRQVRDFASGLGTLEKSDPIDAGVLVRFGEVVEVSLATPKSEDEERHTALVRRRKQLQNTITQEKNRLQQTTDAGVRDFIAETLKHLKKQLKTIDDQLARMMKQMPELSRRAEVLASAPGVGQVTVSTILCELHSIVGKLPN